MGKHTNHSAQYLLRMTPEKRESLNDMANRAGIPLADAMRIGTERYLRELLAEQSGKTEEEALVSNLRAAAAHIERKL
jgi:hypothetical protein